MLVSFRELVVMDGRFIDVFLIILLKNQLSVFKEMEPGLEII